ncbi:unnamed protein product [Lampetra planeri]
MERNGAWMIARLLVALLLLQGPTGITGQTPATEKVDCNLPENNPAPLDTVINGGSITANVLMTYTPGQFACLNAATLNKISAGELAILFDSKFWNNASVAKEVTLKVTDLQKLGDLLAAIKAPSLDANVTAAMMAVVWPVLNASLATMPEANVTDWFKLRLRLLLPAVTVAQIADIPINVSCVNFTVIFGSLSAVYDNVSDTVRRAVVDKVKVFVKQDSCCNAPSDSRTLLSSYFGNYRKDATYAEFLEVFLQFNGFGVEDLLTTVQNADFAATDKAIQSFERLNIVLTNITDLEIFVDEFNIKAAGKTVPQAYQQFLMNLACSKLYTNLDTMTDANVSKWFVNKLPPLFLPGVTTRCLSLIRSVAIKIPCTTMSTILGSLSKLYNKLDTTLKSDITTGIKDFLRANSTCSTAMTSITLFTDYFGNFSENIIYTEFCIIFPPFNAETVLPRLTPLQLAGYSATNKVLNNVTKLTPIFANHLNDINAIKTFMIEFNKKTADKELPEASRAVLLQGVWDKLILNLPTMADLEVSGWFGNLSSSILPGITAADVASIPVSISCPAFSRIISGLNAVYAKLNDTIKTAVVTKIKEFVKSSASCPIDSTQLITGYFMAFTKNITYAEIVDVLPSFDAGQVSSYLTVVQLADYAATDNVLNNTAILNRVLSTINYDTLGPFLDEFNVKANGKTVPKASQDVLMQYAWLMLGPTLPTLSDEDVRRWFVARLSPHVLPGTSNVDVDTIPVSLSCPAFTTIVGSLSAVYSQLNETVKPQMVRKIKNFVKPAVASSKCTPAITSSNLLTDYFGKFRDNATDADFKEVFPSYAAIANPKELGDYAATDTVLNDAPSLAAIFPKLTDLNALGQFLDEFNLKAAGKTVPKASQATLMQGAWNNMNRSSAVKSFIDADVKTWFVDRLSPLILPGITAANVADLPLAMSCDNFNFLVGKLDAGLSSNDTKQATYQWIIRYLTKAKTGTQPPCFANKNSWIVDNMGQSFLLSKLSDLNGFVQDTTQRKTFVVDASTLKLLETPNNMDMELRRYLVQMMNESSLPLSSVPKPLLCTYVGEYGSSLPVASFVGLESYLSNCLNSITLPRDKEKVSLNLLTKYTDLQPASIQNLGSAVVYAPLNAIDKNLSSTNALLVLGTLSNQTGWNPGQAQNIVRKLKAANFNLNNADALTKLGGLVSGVPSSTFTNLDSNQLLAFATKSNPDNVATIPDGVQSVIVNKLLNKPMTQLINSLPPSLLAHIPADRLQVVNNSMPKDLAKGQWSEGQALVLVGNMVKTQPANWTEIIRTAPNLLPGFQCSDLTGEETAKSFVTLISANGGSLSPTQASCLASGLSSVDLDQDVPSSVLIYVDAKKFTIEQPACIPLFTSLGKADINKLPKDKSRTSLLTRALSCLNKPTGLSLTASDVAVLGNLSCELSGEQIQSADIGILDNLKQCKVYTAAQATSIEAKLISKYGASSTWTYQNLRDMGDMVTTLSSNTLTGITSTTALGALIEYVTAQTQVMDVTPERLRFSPDLTNIQVRLKSQSGTSGRRKKRATCSGAQLTRQDILTRGQALAQMSAADLGGCISDAVFIESVDDLGKLSFSSDQLTVFKAKIKSVFKWPTSTDTLANIGNLALAFTPAEIQELDLSSIDLVGKLSKTQGWSADQIQAVTKNFMNGKTISGLTATDLRSLGVFVTGLSDLSILDPAAFKDAAEALGSVDKYSLPQLRTLWKKANDSFQRTPSQWATGTISQLGTIVAGASADDINNLTLAQKAEIKPAAIPLIPLEVFSAFSPETIRALGFSSLMSITTQQYNSLSPTSQDILSTRFPNTFLAYIIPPSAGPGLVNVPPSAVAAAQGLHMAVKTLVAAMLLPSLCLLLA